MTSTVVMVRPPATGGLHAHMRHEARLLASLGATVIDAGPAQGRIDGARWHEVPISESARPGTAARAVHRLRSLMRALSAGQDGGAGSPLTFHAHGVRAGALTCLAARLLPPSRRPRLLVTVHNRMPTAGTGRIVGALLMRIVARGADAVLVVSPDLGEAARGAGARTIIRALVPAPTAGARGTVHEVRGPARAARAAWTPGVPETGAPETSARDTGASETGAPETDAWETGVPDGRLSALVLARLAPQKGLDVLLDAVGLLAARATALETGELPFHILVAGDGPLRDHLGERIRRAQLPVTLLGHVSDPAPLLASADLVVQPSLWEGQPVAIQEALQAGRPIIATDAGGTRWVCEDAAVLVPPHDAGALSAAIADLTGPAGEDKRERLRALARERARHLPTEADLTAQLAALIPGLDSPPPPTSPSLP